VRGILIERKKWSGRWESKTTSIHDGGPFRLLSDRRIHLDPKLTLARAFMWNQIKEVKDYELQARLTMRSIRPGGGQIGNHAGF